MSKVFEEFKVFEIEKDIPIPDVDNCGLYPQVNRYPFGLMEVGDSFFVPNVHSQKIGGPARAYGKRTGKTFVTRTVEGGARVWRTA